jgi:hypothetical protein
VEAAPEKEVTMYNVACRSGIIHYVLSDWSHDRFVGKAFFRRGALQLSYRRPQRADKKIDILDIVSDVFLWFSRDHRSR